MILAEHVNELKCIKQTSYYIRLQNMLQRANLESLPQFKLNAYREKIFWGHKCLGTDSFKTGLSLKLSTEKHVRFLHRQGPLFQVLRRWTYVYQCGKTFLYNYQHEVYQQGHALRTNGQSFKFTVKFRSLNIEIHIYHINISLLS